MTARYRRRPRVTLTAAVAHYQCRHCDRPRWRVGGASTLGRHLADRHGLHNRRQFPAVQLLDENGAPVNFDGAATDPDPDADGLICARQDIQWTSS